MKNTKNIHFYRDPSIPGLEISRVKSSRHVFPKHAHDDIFALSLITCGASHCLDKENTALTVSSGEIVLLNPGQVHSGIPVNGQPISYWMLYADIKTMTGFASDIFEKQDVVPEFEKTIINNKSLVAHFKKLLFAFSKGYESLQKETLLIEFFGDLFSTACLTKPATALSANENKAIHLAKNYLSKDLDKGLSLECVAKKVGFSRFHFIRQFKKYTGISPHQFRIQRRIQTSKVLIRRGLPFSEVALETGFSDQSHFTNTFRQYTGATPSQYAHI